MIYPFAEKGSFFVSANEAVGIFTILLRKHQEKTLQNNKMYCIFISQKYKLRE